MLFAPVVIVLLTIVFSRPSSSPSVQVSTVTVSQGESIQAAVDQAAAGDTISVHAGVYGEQVTIDKPLTVEAFGDREAIIHRQSSPQPPLPPPSPSPQPPDGPPRGLWP